MSKNNIYLIMAMITAMISWGISWPAAKIVGQYANPESLIAWRFFFGLIPMIFIMTALKVPLSLNGEALKYILAASFLIIFYNYNYLKGSQIGISGLGGVIVPTVSPIVTFILSALFFKKKLKKNGIYGLVLGLCGSVVLVNIWVKIPNSTIDTGSIYFFLGAISWSLITILTQKSDKILNPINFSFWVYSFGCVLALAFYPGYGSLNIFSYELRFWINFLLISSIALGLGTTVYFYVTMKLGSRKASSFMFIVPFSAIISSSIFLDEAISMTAIIGGAMTISAVYLINK